MDLTTKEKIEIFLREQIANTGVVIKQSTSDKSGRRHPKRDIFEKLRAYVDDFLHGTTTPHSWCVITGLRGVGKTTVLMQIFSELFTKNIDVLFLSVDKIIELLGVSLADVLRVYEEMTGSVFEKREKKLVLFIDEAQYDKKWDITLKDVYDRAKHKVFIYTTGSATLLLHANIDIVRRSVFVDMLPLSFTEYMHLKNQNPLHADVQEKMRLAFLESTDAHDAYQNILALEGAIKRCRASISPLEVQNYIKAGSLPSALLSQPEDALAACDRILERILKEDISEMSTFQTSTLRKAPTVLYMLASADQVSYGSLGKSALNINRHTVKDLLDTFVQAGVLMHVPAYTASHNAQVRQRSKFLFTAPVFRSAIFKKGGSVLSPDAMYAKLLEDVVGLTLHRILHFNDNLHSFFTYDAKAGGADFVVGFSGKKIVIEVGAGKKGVRQVRQTAKRVNPTYSIVIDKSSSLSFDAESNSITIPLDYFLLL